ncbi:MAG: alpha-N-acetylglucosaminidase, partial [Limisphaerales bacterium]
SLKGTQMKLPNPLPKVHPKLRRVSQDHWRYFLNYCCFGYSLPWYDWRDWERLIDWMALNGVNAPLSVTGQEAVWANTCKRLGFSKKEISDFFAGPPYLPFGWMGCLDGWGGPLPKSWIDRHEVLEKQILARERELGMTPVLQGFTGHVPLATAKRFPDARLHKIEWLEWETSLLDPTDPLFARFATVFGEEQRRLFGTDHLYASDTFIEMTPPSGDTNFLAATARAIYGGMTNTDPEAIWVLQSWTFLNRAKFWTQPRIEAFLGAVPDSRMLVLDLYCDVNPAWNRTGAFCGKPWAWCALQNFGDCVGLGGALNQINTNLSKARRDPLANKLSGIGFVDEGLDYNPVVFDFLFERAWSPETVDLTSWLRQYATRAYGSTNTDSAAAWDILRETAFSAPEETAPAMTHVPFLWVRQHSPSNTARLAEAWEHLLRAAPASADSDAYRFDLVNVTRQTLADYSSELQAQAAKAWDAKDRSALKRASSQMLELIGDVDTLLATRSEFLLGTWLQKARGWGEGKAEKDRMEWNARRVITMWGGKTRVRDYSRRQWSGMLSGFYLPRWQKFFTAADATLAAGTKFDTAAFDRELQDWERAWADEHTAYATTPRGDSLEVSRHLWEKYQPSLAKVRASALAK